MAGCNEKNCICPYTDCARHGKCCECCNFHRERGEVPNCFTKKKIVKGK